MPQTSELPDALGAPLAGPTPRAGGFIVTIYGDVVEPRGGTLWIGTLIEVCAAHGISEGLVRTAVSRLVASNRLAGERRGRRSYYRLTLETRAEFARAARALFDPPPRARGWLIRLGEGVPEAVAGEGWASGPGYAVAPDREDLPRPEGLIFAAEALPNGADARAFAARHWDLAGLSAAYRAFADAFGGAAAALDAGARPDGATSLALRLRAVHEYRRVLLSDPRLPEAALPPGWAGAEAREIFAALYLALAEPADRHVHEHFRNAEGPLPLRTPATLARLEALSRGRAA